MKKMILFLLIVTVLLTACGAFKDGKILECYSAGEVVLRLTNVDWGGFPQDVVDLDTGRVYYLNRMDSCLLFDQRG